MNKIVKAIKTKFGTFTPNTYPTEFYKAHGVYIIEHFWAPDEFIVPGYGVHVSEEVANGWLQRNFKADCDKYWQDYLDKNSKGKQIIIGSVNKEEKNETKEVTSGKGEECD